MRAASGSSISLVLTVCLAAVAGCASPKPAEPTAATAEVKETDKQRAERLINFSAESGEPINTSDGKKLICKKESVTNTRLRDKKVCLTPEQWQARTNNAKDSFREALDTSESLPPKGN